MTSAKMTIFKNDDTKKTINKIIFYDVIAFVRNLFITIWYKYVQMHLNLHHCTYALDHDFSLTTGVVGGKKSCRARQACKEDSWVIRR